MTLTEIKKELYKQKPLAVLNRVTKDGISYYTQLYIKDGEHIKTVGIQMLIPLSDIGDAVFHEEMESQLLIRYIIE